ncbi:MAG TPA: helix-turn-helix domain-containing protein [Blastocatellia bacterium]|nr:helix-turn-helix domain-containing protein [Blastocatellia bacterium]
MSQMHEGGKMTTPNNETCPVCSSPLHLLRIPKAAQLVDVRPKTIYAYIEDGSVYAIKVAGKRYRVCKSCLIRPV